MDKPCEHTTVTLRYKQGWFCLDCKQIIEFQHGSAYKYGITAFRIPALTRQLDEAKAPKDAR